MKYLIFNFKDNLLYTDLDNYYQALKSYQQDIIICPSFLYLDYFQSHNFITCAQDVSSFSKGNFTGEVSAEVLKSLHTTYVLIGHLERRHYLKESEEEIILKVKEALNNNLKVIYCLDIDKNTSLEIIYKQIDRLFKEVSPDNYHKIILAYEPFYLIGGNQQININKLNQDINNLKEYLFRKYQTNNAIIYGGSVNLTNIKDLQKLSLDGYLIGEVSNKIDSILALLEILS